MPVRQLLCEGPVERVGIRAWRVGAMFSVAALKASMSSWVPLGDVFALGPVWVGFPGSRALACCRSSLPEDTTGRARARGDSS